MGTVMLGGYTFESDPIHMTMVRPDKFASAKPTYDGAAFFSWGVTIVGKEILLEWNSMNASQFAALDALFQADSQVVFDPADAYMGYTYNVQILDLTGEYYRGRSESNTTRRNVKMTLFIIGEVV